MINKFLSDRLSLQVFSGLFLALAFPPFSIPLMIIPALMVLFLLCLKAETDRQILLWSYLPFVMWNVILTYWLMYATIPGGAGAILANAVLMTIPLTLMRRVLLNGNLSILLKSIISASIWTTYEHLHFRWDLAWPWLSFGNSLAEFPILIQFIEFTGQLGITFLLVFFATYIFEILRSYTLFEQTLGFPTSLFIRKMSMKELYLHSIIFGGLIISIGIINIFLKENDEYYSKYPEAIVSVVQPNYDSYVKVSGFDTYKEAQADLMRIADSADVNEPELILFPENSVQPPIFMGDRYTREIRDTAMNWNTTIVAGLNEVVQYESEKEAPFVYRGIRYGKKYDIFNGSMIWEPNGNVKPYRKYNLVPIVERQPFIEFFAWLDFMNWVDWGSFAGFQKGKFAVNAPYKSGKSSVLICYDSVFPDWSRKYVLNGANVIGIITNDGWWGDTPGHEQHFSFGRLRAIEARRTVARSANNGISGFILPNGNVLSRSEYWERTFITENIPLLDKITFYVQFGDWIGWGSLIITISHLILIFIKRK